MECYILSATCQACVSVVCSLQHITNRFRTEQVATGCNHKCNRRQSVAYSFGSVHAKSTWYEDRFRSGCSQKRQKNRTGPDFKTLAVEVDVNDKRQQLVSNSIVWQSQRILMVFQLAEELSSMVLTKMRETAEQYLNKKVKYYV